MSVFLYQILIISYEYEIEIKPATYSPKVSTLFIMNISLVEKNSVIGLYANHLSLQFARTSIESMKPLFFFDLAHNIYC